MERWRVVDTPWPEDEAFGLNVCRDDHEIGFETFKRETTDGLPSVVCIPQSLGLSPE